MELTWLLATTEHLCPDNTFRTKPGFQHENYFVLTFLQGLFQVF